MANERSFAWSLFFGFFQKRFQPSRRTVQKQLLNLARH